MLVVGIVVSLRASISTAQQVHCEDRIPFEVLGSEPPDWSSRRDGWWTAILPRLRFLPSVQVEEGRVDLHQLDDVWALDSAAVEWTLAEIIANDYRSSREDAHRASLFYRRLSGKAGPVLNALQYSLDEVRQYEALSAISRPLLPSEERRVWRIGCDALWLLKRVVEDSSYWKRPEGVPWVLRTREVLFKSYELLDRTHRAAMRLEIFNGLGDKELDRLSLIDEMDRR